jgi:steroid delta-isomerase-like uncharacterized protein
MAQAPLPNVKRHTHLKRQTQEFTMNQNPVTVRFLQDFAAAWNRHDIDALMSFMADDCAFHATGGPDLLGRSFAGRDAVREGFKMAWQTFADAAWLDGEYFVSGDRGVAESTFRGTKADGTRIEARMVDVFTFRDGKIAVKNAYRKDRPPLAAA